MKVNNQNYRAVEYNSQKRIIEVIDQKEIPFSFSIKELTHIEEVIDSINDMTVRGAPVIGMVAAFGVYFVVRDYHNSPLFNQKISELRNSRPTAVNLIKGIDFVLQSISEISSQSDLEKATWDSAVTFLENEVSACKKIGETGISIIENLYSHKSGKPINILTHCNAGWLACGDWGTATAPMYYAHRKGIPIHVWVDETRPRNQGSRLTAWELHNEGIPFTIIPDNSGGHLIQKGMVDIVITGADRIAANGDTANKIGTYLKALAANHNNVPFYIAAPISTFDFTIENGLKDIPIELRNTNEINLIEGINSLGNRDTLSIYPSYYPSLNHAFDVTPSHLIKGFITEKGIFNHQNINLLQ